MIKLDEKKLTKLRSFDDLLDSKYGKRGTDTRSSFEEKALKNYYCDILKERRKELKLTQKQLAGRTGKERSYI